MRLGSDWLVVVLATSEDALDANHTRGLPVELGHSLLHAVWPTV